MLEGQIRYIDWDYDKNLSFIPTIPFREVNNTKKLRNLCIMLWGTVPRPCPITKRSKIVGTNWGFSSFS
jgi:hypothetical protein